MTKITELLSSNDAVDAVAAAIETIPGGSAALAAAITAAQSSALATK
jgi:hypothetical protein